MRRRLAGSAWETVRRWTTATRVAVTLGVIACLGTGAVFAGVSEDVIRRNGSEQRDPHWLTWVVHHRPSVLVSVAKSLSDVGGIAIVAVLAIAAGGLLWWRGLRLAVALAPAVAVVAADTIEAMLKLLVNRARPPVALHLVAESDPSFPSGHSTGSMAFGVSVALVIAVYLVRRPLARALVLAAGVVFPVAIGASRLELGVHWPTDVVAGLSLGASMALVVTGACLLVASSGGSAKAPADSRRERLFEVLRSHRNVTLRLAA